MKRSREALVLLQILTFCVSSFAQGARPIARTTDSLQTVSLAKIAKVRAQIGNDDLRMGDLVKLDVGLLLESKEPV